jgi:uncharacterized protein (DUF1501 family)
VHTSNRSIDHLRTITRRHFYGQCGVGLGQIALASLLAGELMPGVSKAALAASADNPLAPRPSHYAPKAKRVIYLFMAGAPSQLDLFDYKPALVKHDGQPIPAEIVRDQRYAFIRRDARLLAPRFKFARHGQCGAEVSEIIPGLAEVVDDVALVKAMHTDQFNHAPGQLLMNTGSSLPGRPCLGSWVSYGIGSQSENLPAFVVLPSGSNSAGVANFSSGFLPTTFTGVPLRSKGDPILNLSSPAGIDPALQRETINLVERLNRRRLEVASDPEIATRIAAYEMAYRLQTSAPELMNIAGETKQTLDMYGAEPGKASFANNCLLARRLLERGVRFVNIYHEAWDHHTDVEGGLRTQCGLTDKPCAALVKDLKQRGLLDETLVVWGGEFGRTPMVESNAALGRKLGRDHHPQAFTMWLAGGGVKGGITLGKTDDLGFHTAEDPVHVHDLQATILHLLGLDHKRLTYKFQGRDFRLTDVSGNVVEKILA